MMLRVAKIALVAAVGFFYTLVVFNNVTDYPSNYRFVHHVLLMDTTFPGNEGMWRAIHPFVVQTTFYDGIILWESITMLLTWVGVVQLLRACNRSPRLFQESKNIAIAALTLGMLLWFVAFITVGGEWFLMWQSKTWNGQEAAFRMFACIGIVLLVLIQPEASTKLEG
jgi:predicted small integral membrane protein